MNKRWPWAIVLLTAATSTLACGKRPSSNAADANNGDATDALIPTVDSAFADSDGDGLLDADEGAYLPGGPRDSDGDGTPDYLDADSDNDGINDRDEGNDDWDGDGVPNSIDPRNDGPPPELLLTAISTAFTTPIGIDYHEPTKSLVMSVNYGTGGIPSNFERIEFDGTHQAFSAFSGLTDEVKIATARAGNPAGVPPGTLFTGNGLDGEIVRIAADGSTIDNPWVTLPGVGNGLMRGSLYIDRTGIYGGDLVVVTTTGEVWRVTINGAATRLAAVGVHLEGMITVPNVPVRYGPLAGKIIAGAEGQGLLYAFAPDGSFQTYTLGVAIEDIDLITPKENFFGVNFGTSRLLGATAENMRPMVGDILLAQETVAAGSTGLFRLQWDGTELKALAVPLKTGSATVGQWEHVTMAAAGINEVPPVE